MTTYRGPARSLTLADGTVLERGKEATLDAAVKAALEKAGHRFSDTSDAPAAQSAAENLAAQGTTAEQQASKAGLSVDKPKK